MKPISPIDPFQNTFENNMSFKRVYQKEITFEGKRLLALTYRDTSSLMYKIVQVALAAILTLMTLGLVLSFEKGLIWKRALARFQEQIVYQKIAVPQLPLTQSLPVNQPSNVAAPIPVPGPTPIPPKNAAQPTMPVSAPVPVPIVSPAPIVAVAAVPKPAPQIIPAVPVIQQSPADLALMKEKEQILQENPEYRKASAAWDKDGVAVKEQVARLQDLRKYAFGTDKWVRYFGNIVSGIPILPENIHAILKANDPLDSAKTIQDTHVLVLVPEAVRINGQLIDMSIASLDLIARNPKAGGNKTKYEGCYVKPYANTPAGSPHFVLLRRDVLPDSIRQTYSEQKKMVENEYSGKAGAPHEMPNAIDVAASCLLTFVSTGIKLFDSTKAASYTRCQEQVDCADPDYQYYLIVGKYDVHGLYLTNISDSGSHNVGVAPARKFY